MSPTEEKDIGQEADNATLAGEMLQIWRDYYDEIFEVDLKTGAFRAHSADNGEGLWARSGFTDIEVILLAEKSVHPDDKASFKEFFDLDIIRDRLSKGIYVSKLNFRIKLRDDDYYWVKVKNMIPTKSVSGEKIMFSCFRRVDNETGNDMLYKQGLSDALASARALNERRNKLLNRIFREVKSPLNGVIGIAGLLKKELMESENSRQLVNPVDLLERIDRLESEAIAINRVLNQLVSSNIIEKDEMAGVQFTDTPINQIRYKKPKENARTDHEYSVPDDVPNGFAITAEQGDVSVSGIHTDSCNLRGKRILIVEDNELNIEVMKTLLEASGAKVDTVMDGKSAVIEFIANPSYTYSLIILDINLPVLDGYSALKCIRYSGKDDGVTIPVYAVTSNVFSDEIRKAYKAGFNAFFAKPVDFNQLFERINKEIVG